MPQEDKYALAFYFIRAFRILHRREIGMEEALIWADFESDRLAAPKDEAFESCMERMALLNYRLKQLRDRGPGKGPDRPKSPAPQTGGTSPEREPCEA